MSSGRDYPERSTYHLPCSVFGVGDRKVPGEPGGGGGGGGGCADDHGRCIARRALARMYHVGAVASRHVPLFNFVDFRTRAGRETVRGIAFEGVFWLWFPTKSRYPRFRRFPIRAHFPDTPFREPLKRVFQNAKLQKIKETNPALKAFPRVLPGTVPIWGLSKIPVAPQPENSPRKDTERRDRF